MKLSQFFQKEKSFFLSQIFLLRTLWRSSPWQTILSVIVEALNNFLPLFTAYLWKLITDQLVISYQEMCLSGSLWAILGSFVFLQTIRSVINFGSNIASEDLGNKLEKTLNLQLMEAMSELECSFYDDPQNADMLNKVHLFKSEVSQSISSGISLILTILSFVTALIMFIPHNPLFGIGYILTFIPGSIAEYKSNQRVDLYSIDSIPENRQKNYYRSILTEALYAQDLRLYNLSDYFKNKFNDLWITIRKERAKLFKKGTWSIFLAALLSISGLIALLTWSIHSVIIGAMTIGTLSMYINLSQTVGRRFNYLSFSLPFYHNVTIPKILAYKEFVETVNIQVDEGIATAPHMPEIEFCDVCFKYPNSEEYVINHLSFKIGRAKKLALVGANGAGKSTIIKLLLRFYEPQEGKILLNGEDIKKYSKQSVRELFGVCFQDIYKYSMSFRENIALSDMKRFSNTKDVTWAATQSGADKIYKILPNGVDTNLSRDFDDDGYEPSGGQWQKIAISRAFFRKSDIVILDEPSSALDPEAEHFIFQRFHELCADKGGIIISHRLSSISMVDTIILIDKGRVLESGTHQELIEKNGEYARLYNMQASKYRMEV